MDFNTAKEEEFGFSGNYFLANEMGSSGKKSARKLSDINVVDEQSLTPNGQSVFRILAEYQLSHPNDEGMAIDNLYSIPRERFLVSSQQHELPCKDGLRPSKNRKEKERQAMENSSSSSELQKLIEAIKISEVVKGRAELIAKLADLHLFEQFDVKSLAESLILSTLLLFSYNVFFSIFWVHNFVFLFLKYVNFSRNIYSKDEEFWEGLKD
uniref:Uncharacterized protein n=1 Tax=Gossypium raimondii TaxID=29730 RepID=A0A0D2UJM8_GOSRA|nr:hypothetical protein B456_011G153000 [Gossypium raimondii]